MSTEYDGADPDALGLLATRNGERVFANLSVPALYEEAVRRGEGIVARGGPLVVNTGKHTGRSPNDKFYVREATSEGTIWWTKENRPFEEKAFESLLKKVENYLKKRDLFVQDLYAGADPMNRIGVRVVTERAWCALFARHLFLDYAPSRNGIETFAHFTVVHAPGYQASPEKDGTNSGAFILINFRRKMVLIGGTEYAGEIKKSVFTIMNYMLPERGVLPMHCSANFGTHHADEALFFGLSGTGKTSLSADPQRILIGDDEHGWSDSGIFNFEGGCYAKVIRLSPTAEPEIYQTTRMFGTVLENVVFDKTTRELDLDDESLTENTRGAYPISYISNSAPTGLGGHPKNLVMLTADAFGVLPPVSKLSREQAIYYFLSGYTSRLAGTEVGIAEPQATFSSCFGSPFLPTHPSVYAGILGKRIRKYKPDVWLVNTGWTGGPHGVGHRIPIAQTRAMVQAALSGVLSDEPFYEEPYFGLRVPVRCPGVDPKLLRPRDTWDNREAYDAKARSVAASFVDNFKGLMPDAKPELVAAGPRKR